MNRPNFFIIGGVRCGTSSLYQYLKQHPDVYMPSYKEPGFFVYDGKPPLKSKRKPITTLESYLELFDPVSDESAIGEASAIYLYRASRAAPRIRDFAPDAKIIAILRNPVDRAHSQFLMAVRFGHETHSDFEQALAAEQMRVANGSQDALHYKRQGFYFKSLKSFLSVFGRDQVRVYLFEDFIANPLATVRDVFGYLGVDESFEPRTSRRFNDSRVPRNKRLHALLTTRSITRDVLKPFVPPAMRKRIAAAIANRNLKKPKMSEEARQRLKEAYREDVLRLQELMQRDLSSWLA